VLLGARLRPMEPCCVLPRGLNFHVGESVSIDVDSNIHFNIIYSINVSTCINIGINVSFDIKVNIEINVRNKPNVNIRLSITINISTNVRGKGSSKLNIRTRNIPVLQRSHDRLRLDTKICLSTTTRCSYCTVSFAPRHALLDRLVLAAPCPTSPRRVCYTASC
jgi:hypothetical protein